MAYRVVEEAVEIFMAAFYQSLLARGASVHDATHVARAALLRNQSRRARYMHNVQLADYIVPVHYASSSHLDPPGINDVVGTGEAGVSSYVQRIFASLKQITPSGPAAGGPLRKDMPPGFLGRDYNILSLEMLLSVSRLVLVHGQGGVGKTELLRSAFQWWKTSGWITAAVYVNLDHGKGLYSMKDIVAKIAEQLGLAPEKEDIEDVVIKNLRRRKCLLVFDSAETLDSSIQLDKVIWSPDLAERLRRFIDAAISDSESKVIVSSRLETTAVANIPSERHVYPLLGLSVLDSTTLLQNPSVGPGEELPEGFSRRENIDGLRRVAILLEGNPLALELVAPELKRVKYNGETLFHNLLYGVCKTHVDGNELNRGRFIRSLHIALKDPSFLDSHATLIEACQFAPFWTLMPKDLAPYYWFFHLASSKYSQGSYATWISEEFRDTVKRSTMAQRLRVHWANIEARLIEAGILCHATITRKDGKEIRCYHVHPIYTLVSRSFLTDETWKAARFAFVRQALLWHPEDDDNALQWAKIEWGGAGPQHDDHLHNWRAMAVGWSVYDGNPQEEVERMGVTMMDCTYRLSIGAVWKNPRQARLLIPHVRAYLTQIYQTAGAILSASSLQAIIDYSLTLWRLEPDGVGQSAQSDVVKRALAAVERWRAARPPGLAILPPAEEVMWFQLRHVEATMVEQTGHLAQAKAMHQRNLETDPMATIPALCNIIRRSHLRSLTAWANCVTTLATQEGALSKTAIMSTAREFTSSFGDKRACEMMGAMAQVMAGHKAAMKSVRVRDTIGFALEREPAAVARFGALATSTIDMPLFDVFADHVQGEVVEYMADLFAAAQRSVDAESAALRAQIRAEESGLHLLAGDTAAAAKTVQAEMAREALSSTTSTGWEKLADLHMYMHMLVVMRAEKPDYGKGLMHLQEWWRLHRGAGMPKKDVAFGFMKIATCYSGLGRLADAARAIIKVAGVLRALEPSDCIDGDVVGEREWILERIAGYEELQVFLSPMIVFSTSSEVAELSLKERLTMHRIMTKAKKTEKAKKEADQMFLQVEAMLEQVKLLRETGV
jgi:phage terminase large subunit-like protein